MSQPYDRVFNFSAGPCTLPVGVLEQARDEMLNCRGAGMSVMEMSHRSKAYESIIERAEADLRALLGIPEGYRVLFLQGGASLQFTMLPMAFLGEGRSADYVVTGSWGEKAVEAACLEGNVQTIFSGKATNYDRVPDLGGLSRSPGAEYLHFTSNETIQGVEFAGDPGGLGVPVVCDMSSDILSRPCDVSKYSLIYAGAQKNMGPAGVVVVIVADEMLGRQRPNRPPMLDYRLQAEHKSLYNTPPCYSIYICGLVFQWLLDLGGLEGMNRINREKADAIYAAIDGSGGYYKGHAQLGSRSIMNITFTLADPDLTDRFVSEAKTQGLDGLKGHRSVGGVRASIYNAFPLEGCQALAAFMREFAAKNG
ncbi:MAG TPA: 3-phosphoserine/phosphohydroxythreonine transaminase [Fimbriimonadaceae bacterium]|nr:3-phosphoserine/phosphohydroxythreonine transaminase [Fimbriimonadaceae bacterium]HRJ96265.1 3-phosphoserine/phosphohydroxythreonine transaminase [Fimbriimonadaceae bacterium]